MSWAYEYDGINGDRGVQITWMSHCESFPVISLPVSNLDKNVAIFTLLQNKQKWPVLHRLWSWFHMILTVASHFSQFPPLLEWQNVMLGYGVGNWLPLNHSVQLPSSFWVYTCLNLRLHHTHLVHFSCPESGASDGGEMRLVVPNIFLAHILSMSEESVI